MALPSLSGTSDETGRPAQRGVHWLTILATGLVAFAALLANADGYHNHLFGEGDFQSEPPTINWTHGWPLWFAARSSIYPLPGASAPIAGGFTGDFGTYSRWPLDDSPLLQFKTLALVVDIVALGLLLGGTATAVQRLTRRWRIRNRFGLKGIFGLVTLIAVGLALGPSTLLSQEMRHLLHWVVVGVLAVATGATLWMLASFALAAVLRLDRAWRGSKAVLADT